MEGFEPSIFFVRFYPRHKFLAQMQARTKWKGSGAGMAICDYTESNLATVRTAKLAFAAGTRKVRLSMGDMSIEYAVPSEAWLDKLELQIVNGLRLASRPPFFMAETSKGLLR